MAKISFDRLYGKSENTEDLKEELKQREVSKIVVKKTNRRDLECKTKKKMVKRENGTGGLVPKRTKNARIKKIIASGATAATRRAKEPTESDSESENESLRHGSSHTATGPLNVPSNIATDEEMDPARTEIQPENEEEQNKENITEQENSADAIVEQLRATATFYPEDFGSKLLLTAEPVT